MSEKSIFKKIIDGEIPADIVYQDDHCLAFRDINPQAPTHVLLIPKQEIPSMDALTAENHALCGHLMLAIQKVADAVGLENGYRVVLNNGRDAGQEVDHIHFHILGGRGFRWPPG